MKVISVLHEKYNIGEYVHRKIYNIGEYVHRKTYKIGE